MFETEGIQERNSQYGGCHAPAKTPHRRRNQLLTSPDSAPSATAAVTIPRPGLLSLSVDGIDMLESCSDFHRFWAAAATEFRTRILIKPPGEPQVAAVVYMLYFPFVNQQDTVPSLVDLSLGQGSARGARGGKASASGKGKKKEETTGLGSGGAIADNLTHVFWMGRYLPRGLGGRDEQLKWMKPRREQCSNIPNRVWRRVRAFIFLPPQFEADRTKQALVPGACYTQALMGQTDRRLQDRYCSWVSDASKSFDQELWYDKPIAKRQEATTSTTTLSQSSLSQSANQVSANEQGRYINYERVHLGGTCYALGDMVEVEQMNGAQASRIARTAAASIALASSSSVASSRSGGKILGILKHCKFHPNISMPWFLYEILFFCPLP